jgi:hypothetical protein
VNRGFIASLLPLALGHDQEASACPWVQLTHRTSAYPSRIAQAALLIANGTAPITPDLIDQLYLYDDLGPWHAHSILPGPPDLPRALWQIRSTLVAANAVPEVLLLATALRELGSIYGDLKPAFAELGAGDAGSDVLFVPGAATLFYDPDAARAALTTIGSILGRVDLQPDLIDSGHVARELGLAGEAEAIRDHVRRRVTEAGYRLVVAGTPKEAFGLREMLAGLPVEVCYAGSLIARADHPPCHSELAEESLSDSPSHSTRRTTTPPLRSGRFLGKLGMTGGSGETSGSAVLSEPLATVVFHPSETLLHRLDEFDAIDQWLRSWFGETYRPEPEPKRNAWPAAIERPAIRVPETLTRALAERRMEQLLEIGGKSPGRRLILTCDPFSLRALREVAPPEVTVMDLLVAAVSIEEGNTEE